MLHELSRLREGAKTAAGLDRGGERSSERAQRSEAIDAAAMRPHRPAR